MTTEAVTIFPLHRKIAMIGERTTMSLTSEAKTKLIQDYRTNETDTGSPEVQVAILTGRINDLTKHFEAHVKDHSSRRGLLRMVGRRRKLLSYLKRHNDAGYKDLINKLGIRK